MLKEESGREADRSLSVVYNLVFMLDMVIYSLVSNRMLGAKAWMHVPPSTVTEPDDGQRCDPDLNTERCPPQRHKAHNHSHWDMYCLGHLHIFQSCLYSRIHFD